MGRALTHTLKKFFSRNCDITVTKGKLRCQQENSDARIRFHSDTGRFSTPPFYRIAPLSPMGDRMPTDKGELPRRTTGPTLPVWESLARS